MKRIVLIPAYCPSSSLIALCKALQESGADIVITDDGSPEEYRPVFDACPGVKLTHGTNRGKGAALKTALAWLRANVHEEYTAVTADADGQHLPEDILRCLSEAEAHPDALTLGCRDFSSAAIPARSRIGNRLAEALFALVTQTHVKDTQTGLRAFHCIMTDELYGIRGDRYEYEMNVLLAFASKKIPFHEVRIETVYEGNNECSHFRPLRDTLRILKPVILFALSSLTAFLADCAGFVLFSEVFRLGASAANVTARFFSASLNYEINRRCVFQSGANRAESLAGYACTALVILVLNTALLTLLIRSGMNRYAAKIIAELSLFLLSYSLQRAFVFRQQKGAVQ